MQYLARNRDRSLLAELTRIDLTGRLRGDTPIEVGPPGRPQTERRAALMQAVLRRFRDRLGEQGVAFVVAILPSLCAVVDAATCPPESHIRPGSTRNERLLAFLCQREKLEYVDLLSIFASDPAPAGFFDLEDLHLSPRGNDEVGRAVADALRGQLRDRPSAS